MMTDVTVISQRLGPIAEEGKNIAKLQTLVKDKSMPRKNVSQAMAGLLKRSTSKKETDQEETMETTAEKDDGDEDGESLGILTSEQATDQEAQTAIEDAERKDATPTSAVEAAPLAASEATLAPEDPASAIPSAQAVEPSASGDQIPDPTASLKGSVTEPTNPFDAVPPPSIPPKDTTTEAKTLEATEAIEPVATETLVAPLTQEKELPVQPVSPIDPENDLSKDSVEAPPAVPVKEDESESSPMADTKSEKLLEDNEEIPEVPAKSN